MRGACVKSWSHKVGEPYGRGVPRRVADALQDEAGGGDPGVEEPGVRPSVAGSKGVVVPWSEGQAFTVLRKKYTFLLK